jgi:4-deoxy-L-threo-5-hexosulose-uronate ketol-isomerase
METRYSCHPDHLRTLDTAGLRGQFLIDGLFQPDAIVWVYSHIDRIITGSAVPVASPLALGASKELGTEFFMQRREMGIINVGGSGVVSVDGHEFPLGRLDALYVGMGAREVRFRSAERSDPARLYFNSTPAHAAHPTRIIRLEDARKLSLGAPASANVRTIHQYVHPAVLPSCQLVMGLTRLEPGSTWNTMPSHTHERRMEVYLYFDLPQDAVVFHLMGTPDETRHLVVRNEQAVISPSWSVHSGVGTRAYSFIWGMAGENQTFEDMDAVPMSALR